MELRPGKIPPDPHAMREYGQLLLRFASPSGRPVAGGHRAGGVAARMSRGSGA
jgi:hypothetical protein